MAVDTKKNVSHVKNPVFRHDNATLTCDSANFYTELNYFEAFNNVHINQADTVNIFSDLLNYDGNTKIAHLINNVRLVDPTTVLTTNVLDYNMAFKRGTYENGGKIVNKDVVLTSKRGWYFANTSDAYFRYNVDVVTPQVNIKSDTLRYNTATNWTYFYGPTNIKGKNDNLYTENGTYNTKSENALFGKKNLYTQGSKSLKGDSLFYYGKKGYGKAVKNITFIDTEDNLLLRGQLGEYYKIDERIVVSDNAYVGLGTADSVLVNDKKVADSLWVGADTLQAQMVLQKTLKLIATPIVLKDNEIGAETEQEKKDKQLAKTKAAAEAAANKPKKIAVTPVKKPETKKEKRERELSEKLNGGLKLKTDSVSKLSDSIKTDSIKLFDIKKDSLKINNIKKDSLSIIKNPLLTKDTVKNKLKVNGKIDPKKVTVPTVIAKGANKTVISKPLVKDSIMPFNPADTVRTRTIRAYHNVRVFKSNLQAKSDSLFYTAADSTLRWYQDPMIWSENSQQTGDTIYVQFKNKKVNSLQVLKNGFMVNTEGDSTKFNQVKGKLMTGFFIDGELKTMYVDGNAESIYFTKEKGVDKMNQTVSGRIKFNFVDKELDNIVTVKSIEGAYSSDKEIPKEAHLTGFIWKPELRPVSKVDIIKGKTKKKVEKPTSISKPKVATKSTSKDKLPKKPALSPKKPITDNAVPAKTTEITNPQPTKVKLDSLKSDTTNREVKVKN